MLLADAVTLTGVKHFNNVALEPVNVAGGRTAYNLTPNLGATQTPVGTTMAELVILPSGHLGPVVCDYLGDPIDDTLYTIDNAGVHFVDAGPSGATLSTYAKASLPATTWALRGNTLYAGGNANFNRIEIRVDGGARTLVDYGDLDEDTSYVTTASASGTTATHTCLASLTTQYIGEFGNWVDDHMQTRPDVFVGTQDYPGDSWKDEQDITHNPGQVPSWVARDTYQLNARDGMVSFFEDVDSTASPVRAMYAYIAGAANVTGQTLDVVPDSSGKVFRAITDTLYPTSIGARWVNRDTVDMPRNFYVNGVIAPQVVSVAPFDNLSVET